MGNFRSHRKRQGQAMVEFAFIVPLAVLLVLGAFDTSVMGSDKIIATSAVRNGARVGTQLGGLGNTSGGANTCSGAAPTGTTMAAVDREIILTVLSAMRNMTFIGTGTGHTGVPDEIDIYRPGGSSGGLQGKLNKGTDLYEQYQPEVSTLTTSRNAGVFYTRLNVTPLPADVPGGAAVVLTDGTKTQTVTTSGGGATAGSTTLNVISFQANATYSTSTTVYPPSTAFQTEHHGSNTYTMDLRCQGPLGKEAELGVRVAWTYKPANGIPGPNFVFDDGVGAGHLPADWAVEKETLCVENCVIK